MRRLGNGPRRSSPPPVPSGPGQIFRSSSGKHFLGLEGVKWGGGGGFKIWLLSFFFPFVCLSLIDCGVLGLRPQRSGVKDVRCRVNKATLIRFWPPSALTSSSRTPVPWRGDTFDLRLVCRRLVALLLFFFLPQNSTPLATFSSGRLWSCGGGRRRTVKRKKNQNKSKICIARSGRA